MFSVKQKRIIANRVRLLLLEIGHPELPKEGPIEFHLHVKGAEPWSWADIQNNEAVESPMVNPWNESQAGEGAGKVSGYGATQTTESAASRKRP